MLLSVLWESGLWKLWTDNHLVGLVQTTDGLCK